MKTMAMCALAVVASTGCWFGPSAADAQKNFTANMNRQKPIPDYAKKPANVPEAQAALVPAARAGLAGMSPPPTFLKAYPEENDWTMVRDPNGVITAREIRVAVFYKGGQSGFCRYEDTTMHEDEQGGSWGRPTFSGFGSSRLGQAGQHVDCAEVDALPHPPG